MSGRHEQWRSRFDDLEHAYVLGALDEDERREFEGYLVEHPELQAEVDELGSVAGLLALAPQEYEPHPGLKRDLLRRIGDAEVPEVSRRAGLRRRLSGPVGFAAAAAVLAVVGLFVWNVSLLGENEELRGEVEARDTHELRDTGDAGEVRGEVVEVGDGEAVLLAEDLPPAPEGQVYEAWLLRGSVPEPAGLFESEDGAAAARIEGSLEGADIVAVTLEPSGGSPMPTTEPLLTASL